MIKFAVIDLICCLCAETFLDDSVFLFRDLHLEVVEDRSETSEVNKACSCAVFVLEVWLDQESSVLHISSKSLQTANKNLFFSIVEHIFRIKNGWCTERVQSLCWVFLEVSICENGIICFAEGDIINQTSILWSCILGFEGIEFCGSQLNSLSIKNTSEFLCWDIAFAENIMILEEFQKSNTILLNHVLDLYCEFF